ncbi:MAG TPA: smr domain-containing protein [Sneathiellales bacterium]|jgi:DNA-nicking Smr family endonuclease|nr:smr domain-containing protein [Sneathiellales bacterium]
MGSDCRKKPGTRIGGRYPSADEEALWHHVVRDTQPLRRGRQSAAVIKPSAVKPHPHGKSDGTVRHLPQTPHVASATLPASAGLGLDKHRAQRLKRGRTAIEGRLDLHGLTLDQAHGALDQFVERAVRSGKRCVLVITGKGRRANLYDLGSDDRGPDNRGWGDEAYREPRGVLREAVPKWLQVGAQRNQILAIEPARPQHGGDGAFYVLLRRKRT